MHFHFHNHLAHLRKENGKYIALENKPTLQRAIRSPRRLRVPKKKPMIASVKNTSTPKIVFRKVSGATGKKAS